MGNRLDSQNAITSSSACRWAGHDDRSSAALNTRVRSGTGTYAAVAVRVGVGDATLKGCLCDASSGVGLTVAITVAGAARTVAGVEGACSTRAREASHDTARPRANTTATGEWRAEYDGLPVSIFTLFRVYVGGKCTSNPRCL